MAEPLKILVIEDDPGLLQLLEVLLGADPRVAEVRVLDDGNAAEAAAAELGPDVVILDTGVPGDGDVIGPRLRERFPSIRLISFSGYDKPAPWADERIVKGGNAAEQLSMAIFKTDDPVPHDEMRRFLHDIRNPVGAILGFTHILENRHKVSEEQLEEILAAIRRVTERLSHIIDEFSDEHR